MNFGVPPKVAHNFARLAPGFVADGGFAVFTIATLLTLAWFWLIVASPRSPWRAVNHWAAGVTLVWVLLIVLWLPWIDYGKSYRSVAISLKRALPESGQCLAGRRVGAAQRASLQYFAGIVTVNADTRAGAACGLLLVQGNQRSRPAPAGWHKLWEGHRPGDRSERLRLYQRD